MSEPYVFVDTEKCTGCGACVADCVAARMHLEGGKATCSRACFRCGHCVAVCPEGAISIPSYAMEEVQPAVAPGDLADSDEMLRLLKSRRSVRDFKDQPLSEAHVQAILNAGRYAPTAKNVQGTEFVFVQRDMQKFRELLWEQMPQVIEALAQTEEGKGDARGFGKYLQRYQETGNDGLLFNAPAYVIVLTEEPLDGGLAAAYMEMEAFSCGAGMLYSGYTRRAINASPKLQEWLGIQGKTIAACMLVGYPSRQYAHTAPRAEGNFVVR